MRTTKRPTSWVKRETRSRRCKDSGDVASTVKTCWGFQRFDRAFHIPGVLVSLSAQLVVFFVVLVAPSLERTTAAWQRWLGPDKAVVHRDGSNGSGQQSGATRSSGTGGLVIPDDVVVHRHGCNGSGLRSGSTCGITELIPSDPNTCWNSWPELVTTDPCLSSHYLWKHLCITNLYSGAIEPVSS